MSDPSITIPCDCYWLSCQLRTTLFEDTGSGSVELILPRRTLWERLRTAIRYVIGRSEPAVAEVILSKEQVFQLTQFLSANEFISWRAAYQENRAAEMVRLPESRL